MNRSEVGLVASSLHSLPPEADGLKEDTAMTTNTTTTFKPVVGDGEGDTNAGVAFEDSHVVPPSRTCCDGDADAGQLVAHDESRLASPVDTATPLATAAANVEVKQTEKGEMAENNVEEKRESAEDNEYTPETSDEHVQDADGDDDEQKNDDDDDDDYGDDFEEGANDEEESMEDTVKTSVKIDVDEDENHDNEAQREEAVSATGDATENVVVMMTKQELVTDQEEPGKVEGQERPEAVHLAAERKEAQEKAHENAEDDTKRDDRMANTGADQDEKGTGDGANEAVKSAVMDTEAGVSETEKGAMAENEGNAADLGRDVKSVSPGENRLYEPNASTSSLLSR